MTVPESYVRRLEQENLRLRQLSPKEQPGPATVTHDIITPGDDDSYLHSSTGRLVEDSTTEHFVSKLKGIHDAAAPDTAHQVWQAAQTPSDVIADSHEGVRSSPSAYTFILLKQDKDGA